MMNIVRFSSCDPVPRGEVSISEEIENEHKNQEQGHGEAEAEGHGHGEEKSDPLHHIKDKPLVGFSASGQLVWWPVDDHGHPKEGYQPATIGPIRLEFTKHMWDVTLTAVVLTAVLIAVTRRVVRALPLDQAPKSRLANAVEAVILYVRNDVIVPSGGKHIAPYTPIFLTYFFFILTSNLLGMIPEVGTGTANVGVTMALGGSIYLLVLGLGMWNQGPIKYWVNLIPHGTPLPLAPLMLFLEIVSPIIKCFVLCVRLFANMMAGHVIISNVLGLGVFGKGAMLGAYPVLVGAMLVFGVPLAVGVSLLEILVCFLQAYVFTMLSVIFVAAAVHPEH